jgi:hypothetical protein
MDCHEYFNTKTTCNSCGSRIKEENQIVCDYCHENEDHSLIGDKV